MEENKGFENQNEALQNTQSVAGQPTEERTEEQPTTEQSMVEQITTEQITTEQITTEQITTEQTTAEQSTTDHDSNSAGKQLGKSRKSRKGRKSTKAKKETPVNGLLFGVLMIVIFFGIQFAVAGVLALGLLIQKIASANGDFQAGLNAYVAVAQGPNFLTTATFIATIATTGVFAIWYWSSYAKKTPPEERKKHYSKMLQGKNMIMLMLTGVACYFLALNVIAFINLISPDAVSNYLELMKKSVGGNMVLGFLTSAILAPIGEECVFRGILFKKLRKSMPLKAAILTQAIFFGIFHMNFVQGFYVIVLGAAMAYAVYKLDTVWAAIFIHFVNNIMSYLIRFLPDWIMEQDILVVIMPVFPALILFLVWKFVPARKGEICSETGTTD